MSAAVSKARRIGAADVIGRSTSPIRFRERFNLRRGWESWRLKDRPHQADEHGERSRPPQRNPPMFSSVRHEQNRETISTATAPT